MTDQRQRNNISSYYDPVSMPGGWKFNHAETLKLINLYYESQYQSGQFDEQNQRKFFYNIVRPACDIAAKFIDLDTKDFIFVPDGIGDELKVWMMSRKFKQWMRDENFGALINEFVERFPKTGHIVSKKSKTGVSQVNVENLRLDPSVQWIHQSPFVYEPHLMSESDMLDMGWDPEKIAMVTARSTPQDKYLVYECYDRTKDGWERTIKADLFTRSSRSGLNRSIEDLINSQEEFVPSIELTPKRKIADIRKIYREAKFSDVTGRWLGGGFVEYLLDNQIAINEAENLERKGLAYKSMQVWQTRDENIGGMNVLTDIQNGDVILSTSSIDLFPKDNSDLAAFNNTRNNWEANTVRKTNTTDITTGASLPSRTPLGVANLQASLATSYFEKKRQRLGLFLKEMVYEDIIPSFKSQSMQEHMLTFAGSDEEIDKLDKTIADIMLGEAVSNHAEETGFFPSRIVRDAAKERIKRKLKDQKNRYLKIPSGFYRDAKFTFDIVITGESQDTGAKSQTLNTALQIIGTNPSILQDPVARSIFFKTLSLSGVSPVELSMLTDVDTSDAQGQPATQGGSVANVSLPQGAGLPTPQVV